MNKEVIFKQFSLPGNQLDSAILLPNVSLRKNIHVKYGDIHLMPVLEFSMVRRFSFFVLSYTYKTWQLTGELNQMFLSI